ncbi:MAG TPA: acetamidase/formamidase family protein [Candidatus Binatia bacterium]|nr:acetamidase/formamidase family protein [Candidatus Binatia bacterium]
MKTWYLFDVNPQTPPAFEIDSGQELTLEVRGAFADVPDVREVPTPFTPACDGHPLAPIAGPVKVRGAEPGDGVLVDLLEITPHGEGKTAILRDFGVLRQEFRDPVALACPVKDGHAWFGGRIPLPLCPNLGTVSTMPVEGYRPAYAGPYGGDFDQKDVRAGSRIHLPVLVPGALVFFADPHAAISDGIICGTGVECDCTVRARITLEKGRAPERPVIEVDGTVQVLGFGPTVEAATEDAARAAVDYTVARTGMDRREAYMLLSIVGELRIGTSPRPVMAARLIIPRQVLDSSTRPGGAARR